MKVLVIGAHGQIGQLLLPKLAEAGHDVVAMVRDKSQFSELERDNVRCVVGDLEGDFSDVVEGADAVVFAAGSGGSTGVDKTVLIDLWGAAKSVKAAEDKGAKRFVIVSSRGAGEPDSGPDSMKPYLVAKHFADEELKRSSLDWTILRPGQLLNEPGNGKVSTERPSKDAQKIPREDVAAVIVSCLANDDSIGQVYELYSGDHDIDDLFD